MPPSNLRDVAAPLVELIDDGCGLGSHFKECVGTENELELRLSSNVETDVEVPLLEPDFRDLHNVQNRIDVTNGHPTPLSAEHRLDAPERLNGSATSLVSTSLCVAS